MKNIQKAIFPLIIVWSVLAGFFAFTDLQISQSIVNQNSTWALFLQQYGELPGLLIIAIGIFVYSFQIQAETKFIFTAANIISIFGEAATLIYFIYVLLFNVTGSYSVFNEHRVIIAIISLIFSASVVYTFRTKEIKVSELVRNVSKIIVALAFFGYLICIQLVKFFWGRIRFRDLDPLVSNFTGWYVPNGINGHQSFPSGHAAMGWMLLPLFLLALNKNKFVKVFILLLIAAWATAVALSRVVIGAHYASDVTFGAFYIIITFLVLVKKYFSDDKPDKQAG